MGQRPESGQLVPFCGGSYEYRSRGVSVQRTVNLYPEKVEDASGKVQVTLISTPGTELVANIGSVATGACRGFWYSSTGPAQQSRLYACYGDIVYRIEPDFTYTKLGDVLPGTGPVSISDNGFVLAVADGVSLFFCDLLADALTAPSTWAQVTLPTLDDGSTIKVSTVLFLAQRFIVNSQSNQWWFSDLAVDGTMLLTAFPQLNFYSAEQSADSILAMAVVNNRLWFFGDRSYEVWAAAGVSSDDPFSFMSGSASQIGIQAAQSVATIEDDIFWLASSDAGRNQVMWTSGLNTPMRISTNAIEHAIGQLQEPEAGIGFCYTVEGHTFYALTFQVDKRTWVFDVATRLWHERLTHDWDTGTDFAWDPLFAVTAYNKVYHGSAHSNRLLLLSPYKYTDWDGRAILRRRIGPIYWSDGNPVTLREFFIDMEVGTTPLLVGLGRDPQCMLSVSRDGGNLWTQLDWRTIGQQGNYNTTVKWQNLGWGRSFAVDLQFSDPCPITIFGARIAMQEGSRR